MTFSMAHAHLPTFPREPPSASVLTFVVRRSELPTRNPRMHFSVHFNDCVSLRQIQSTRRVRASRQTCSLASKDSTLLCPVQVLADGLLWETAARFDLRSFKVISRAREIRPLTDSFRFHVSGNSKGRRLPRRKNRGMPPALGSPVRLGIK